MRPEIGMKINLEQRPSCLAAGLHAVLATRQLKEGVYLKTARAAQQVLSRDAARHDVACRADRQLANRNRPLPFERTQSRQPIQIARAQIRTTVSNAAHSVELELRIEKSIRVNEKIGNRIACTALVDRAQHLELRSEEHTSELQSHSFISYAVF